MPVLSVADFTDSLRRGRLLDAAQLDELTRQLLPRFPDPKALARELVRRGWLTPYQANQLFQGHGEALLLGSYVILDRLGEGGMGQVFKARNWKLGTVVALKVIRKDRLANEVAVRRFQREIRAVADLNHPHIVRALDADQAGEAHFLVMEFVEGTDLSKLVRERGPLPVAVACDFVRQAALALQHAHERGMVHRDIKPANLLVGQAPGLRSAGMIKILDMGLARLMVPAEGQQSTDTLTREGAVMGSFDYIAPEQALDAHTVDIRADLYSLGCTLYYLLTGSVAFPSMSPMDKLVCHRNSEPMPVEQRRPDVSPAVAAVVRRLMAKRPEDRYATPAEAAEALAGATTAAGLDAVPAPLPIAVPAESMASTVSWSSLITDLPSATPVRSGPSGQKGQRLGLWIGLIAAAVVGLITLVVVAMKARGASPVETPSTAPPRREAAP